MTISATIRDIAIIIIAIQSIVLGVLLGVLVWQVWRLVKLVQTEIRPVITDVQETLGTIRGTTTFVSDNVVDPVVKSSRAVSGLRRTVSVLTADLRPRRRTVARPPENQPPTASDDSTRAT